MTPNEALYIVFYCDDLDDEVSIRDYFKNLLDALWDQGEGFSGKRPFGNSGWELDLQAPLVKFGCVDGEVIEEEDERPWVKNIDKAAYNQFVFEMIAAL